MKKSRMPMRKWSSGRGALLIIAVFFAASAAIRIGSGAGQAISQELAALGETPAELPEPGRCEYTADVENLLAALKERTSVLDARERELQELEQSLEFAKGRIRENMDALVAAEQKLAETISQSDSAAENDLARLTSVYENMKPKEASTIFEQMTPEFAAGFIGRMRPDAAAQIMTGMSPQAAYTISVIIAGRNARAPTE